MARRRKGKDIREFILRELADHPRDIVRVTADHFRITRQAVSRYMKEFISEKLVTATGNTSSRTYELHTLYQEQFEVPLKGLEEDVLWRERVQPILSGLPKNVQDIWQYCFTEMVNNAVDHSDGDTLGISVRGNASTTEIHVDDNGIGIFRKIKDECGLLDEHHAVLELAKGKLTTDPSRHTGEGIFFTSRLLDEFGILSGEVFFSHALGEEEDWILSTNKPENGTLVLMLLSNRSNDSIIEVFSKFTEDSEDYGFNKTVVPVRLARHGAEQLVSRSQARRLLARLDNFNIVVLDFAAVETIGQAFADQIFRIFDREHPNVSLIPIHMSRAVENMILRARSRRHTGSE